MHQHGYRFTAIAGCVCLLAGADSACATVFHVHPGESIQQAILDCEDGDEIIVYAGTYYEIVDFFGKAIWLHSSDGPEVTIISGSQHMRSVVLCLTGETPATIIEGFTVTRGNLALLGAGMQVVHSSPTVRDCIFSDNSAMADGGAMIIYDGSPTVTGCVFRNNAATNMGGAISTLQRSRPVILDCTFDLNYAGSYGGAIHNDEESRIVAINCVLTDNMAGQRGGGVWCGRGGISTAMNCTFANNTALSGAGIYLDGTGTGTATNCIMWDDASPEIYDGSGSFLVTYSNVRGGYVGQGNIDVDPLFINPTYDVYQVRAGSPCIDAGDNASVPAEIVFDRDGRLRFIDEPNTPDTGRGSPPLVDMGAYEYQLNSLIVTGACPGDMRFKVNGATPDKKVAYIYAEGTGSVEIPPGTPCVGVTLGLNKTAMLAGVETADATGIARFNVRVPGMACGSYFMQAIDLETCATTNVVPVQ